MRKHKFKRDSTNFLINHSQNEITTNRTNKQNIWQTCCLRRRNSSHAQWPTVEYVRNKYNSRSIIKRSSSSSSSSLSVHNNVGDQHNQRTSSSLSCFMHRKNKYHRSYSEIFIAIILVSTIWLLVSKVKICSAHGSNFINTITKSSNYPNLPTTITITPTTIKPWPHSPIIHHPPSTAAISSHHKSLVQSKSSSINMYFDSKNINFTIQPEVDGSSFRSLRPPPSPTTSTENPFFPLADYLVEESKASFSWKSPFHISVPKQFGLKSQLNKFKENNNLNQTHVLYTNQSIAPQSQLASTSMIPIALPFQPAQAGSTNVLLSQPLMQDPSGFGSYQGLVQPASLFQNSFFMSSQSE